MKAVQHIARLILQISLFSCAGGMAAAADPFENLPGDTPLLEVLGREVNLIDIEPSADVRKRRRQAVDDVPYEEWLKDARSANIGRCFKPLWDEYAREKGITVTEQEVNEYNQKLDAFMASQESKWKMTRDNLARELIAENIRPDKRTQLEEKLALYNQILEPSPRLSPSDSNIGNEVAESAIMYWKRNQQLYRQYKGRVIFQQAGPEPLDAYMLFLEEQQAKGKFRFFNKDAEDLIFDYYRNPGHTFITDQNAVERSMTTPWWLEGKQENDSYVEAAWGDEVSGLQIRIDGHLGRRTFYGGKTPAFKLDLLNTGDKTLVSEPLNQFVEIELDGRWYKWMGPATSEVLFAEVPPATIHYDYLELELTADWASAESSPAADSQPLSLSSGSHVLRVKFKAEPSAEGRQIVVFSNPLRFETAAPKGDKGQH